MKKKPLTNKSGEVRTLTRKDLREMRAAKDVLPVELLTVFDAYGHRALVSTLSDEWNSADDDKAYRDL